ncbi:MAG TPA: formylmethanofuran dehydrogenase subunit C [Gemmataceae bacterium]|nr:formylmethanofuran dehydrogenase subunit C [Gemmataceae bacterium]
MPVTAAPTKTVLTLKERPHVPLEAEVLTPDLLAGKSQEEVGALPVVLGKRQYRVDDFFDVEGSGGDELEIRGDVGRVKWIGRGMTRGRITVHGDAGMHLGAHMRGGTIEVTGNASDWVGAEMKGGLIRVGGNAGGQVGAAYRGSLKGMREGTILIGGTAGIEVGMRMRRGVIAVRGRVRDFAGLQMKGGTIVLMGGAEIRTGAWMVRGTIISLVPLRLLPTFAEACSYDPVFLRLYARHLSRLGFEVPVAGPAGSYRRYTGDSAVPGKGEILVWQPAAV